MLHVRSSALALVLGLLVVACAEDTRFPLRLGPAVFRVEIARTPHQRQLGLMYRRHLDEDGGMLFVFEVEQELSFWMRNTFIPLSIAFLDSRGRVVDIQDMTPLDETPVRSARPALYALEVNQGAFQRKGVKVGDVIVNFRELQERLR